MTPETKKAIEALQLQISNLQRQLDALSNNTTMPLEAGEAMRARLGLNVIPVEISSKTAASETQAVSEGGSSSYNVAKPPDGFYKMSDGRTIPFYNLV